MDRKPQRYFQTVEEFSDDTFVKRCGSILFSSHHLPNFYPSCVNSFILRCVVTKRETKLPNLSLIAAQK